MEMPVDAYNIPACGVRHDAATLVSARCQVVDPRDISVALTTLVCGRDF